MYAAKAAGRDRVRWADYGLEPAVAERCGRLSGPAARRRQQAG